MANRTKVRLVESPGGKTTIEAPYSPAEHSNGDSMYHHIKVRWILGYVIEILLRP